MTAQSRNLLGVEVRIVQEEDPEEGNRRTAGEGSRPEEVRSYREEDRSCIEDGVRINCEGL